MNNKEILSKKLFIRFLKEENIYNQYRKNLNEFTFNDVYYREKNLSRTNPIDSFTWSSSKEGSAFWLNYFYKYQDIHVKYFT